MRKGMDIIVSEAHRLTNMVEELLEFSRIEDGRFTLSVEPLDLKAELEDAVYTYREFFRKEGIALEYTECPEEMIPISETQGGCVRCSAICWTMRPSTAAAESVSTCPSPRRGRGRHPHPGLRPRHPAGGAPHVKYKFYKGSSKARGSGIGLAVCEEIITRHEGHSGHRKRGGRRLPGDHPAAD